MALSVEIARANIVIQAQSAEFTRALREVRQETEATVSGIQSKFAEVGKAGKDLFKPMLVSLAALSAAAGTAIKSFSDYETALVGLANKLDKPVSGMKDLEAAFTRLSRTMPATREDFLRIAEAGAQLGIKSSAGLEKFAGDIEKISKTTGLVADDVAIRLGQIASAFNIPLGDIDKLGSAINALSDQTTASADAIVSGMGRFSVAARALNIPIDKVLALSTALNTTGASAQRIFPQVASLLDDVAQKSDKMAEALGMSLEEFQRQLAADPFGFLAGLADRIEAGSEAFTLFGDEGIRVMRTLAASQETFRKAQQIANEELRSGASLQQDYARIQATVASQVQITSNHIRELWQEIGRKLAPAFVSALQALNPFLERMSNLVRNADQIAVKMGAVGAAFKNFFGVFVGGPENVDRLLSLFLKMGAAIVALTLMTAGLSLAWAQFSKVLAFVSASLALVTGLMLKLMSPLLLIPIALLVLFTAWDKNWLGIQSTTVGAVKAISDAVDLAITKLAQLADAVQKIPQLPAQAGQVVVSGAKATIEFVAGAADATITWFKGIWTTANQSQAFSATINFVAGAGKELFEQGKAGVTQVIQFTGELPKVLELPLRLKDLDSAKKQIDELSRPVVITVSANLDKFREQIASLAGTAVEVAPSVPGKAAQAAGQVALTVDAEAKRIWDFIQQNWGPLSKGIALTVSQVGQALAAAPGAIGDALESALKWLEALGKAPTKQVAEGIRSVADAAINLRDAFLSGGAAAAEFAGKITVAISQGVKRFADAMGALPQFMERLRAELKKPGDLVAADMQRIAEETVRASGQVFKDDEAKEAAKQMLVGLGQVFIGSKDIIFEGLRIAWAGGRALAEVLVLTAEQAGAIASSWFSPIWAAAQDFFKKKDTSELFRVIAGKPAGTELTEAEKQQIGAQVEDALLKAGLATIVGGAIAKMGIGKTAALAILAGIGAAIMSPEQRQAVEKLGQDIAKAVAKVPVQLSGEIADVPKLTLAIGGVALVAGMISELVKLMPGLSAVTVKGAPGVLWSIGALLAIDLVDAAVSGKPVLSTEQIAQALLAATAGIITWQLTKKPWAGTVAAALVFSITEASFEFLPAFAKQFENELKASLISTLAGIGVALTPGAGWALRIIVPALVFAIAKLTFDFDPGAASREFKERIDKAIEDSKKQISAEVKIPLQVGLLQKLGLGDIAPGTRIEGILDALKRSAEFIDVMRQKGGLTAQEEKALADLTNALVALKGTTEHAQRDQELAGNELQDIATTIKYAVDKLRALPDELGRFGVPFAMLASNISSLALQLEKLTQEFSRAVQKKQTGGLIPGAGRGDRIPALLEPGEYVVRRAAVEKLGLRTMEAINKGALPRGLEVGERLLDQFQTRQTGGLIAPMRMQAGGPVGAAGTVKEALAQALRDILDELKGFASGLGDIITQAFPGLGEAWAKIEASISDLASKIKEASEEPLKTAEEVRKQYEEMKAELTGKPAAAAAAQKSQFQVLREQIEKMIKGALAPGEFIEINRQIKERLAAEAHTKEELMAVGQVYGKLISELNDVISAQGAAGRSTKALEGALKLIQGELTKALGAAAEEIARFTEALAKVEGEDLLVQARAVAQLAQGAKTAAGLQFLGGERRTILGQLEDAFDAARNIFGENAAKTREIAAQLDEAKSILNRALKSLEDVFQEAIQDLVKLADPVEAVRRMRDLAQVAENQTPKRLSQLGSGLGEVTNTLDSARQALYDFGLSTEKVDTQLNAIAGILSQVKAPIDTLLKALDISKAGNLGKAALNAADVIGQAIPKYKDNAEGLTKLSGAYKSIIGLLENYKDALSTFFGPDAAEAAEKVLDEFQRRVLGALPAVGPSGAVMQQISAVKISETFKVDELQARADSLADVMASLIQPASQFSDTIVALAGKRDQLLSVVGSTIAALKSFKGPLDPLVKSLEKWQEELELRLKAGEGEAGALNKELENVVKKMRDIDKLPLDRAADSILAEAKAHEANRAVLVYLLGVRNKLIAQAEEEVRARKGTIGGFEELESELKAFKQRFPDFSNVISDAAARVNEAIVRLRLDKINVPTRGAFDALGAIVPVAQGNVEALGLLATEWDKLLQRLRDAISVYSKFHIVGKETIDAMKELEKWAAQVVTAADPLKHLKDALLGLKLATVNLPTRQTFESLGALVPLAGQNVEGLKLLGEAWDDLLTRLNDAITYYQKFSIVSAEEIRAMQALADWAAKVSTEADPLKPLKDAILDLRLDELNVPTRKIFDALSALLPVAGKNVKGLQLLGDAWDDMLGRLEEAISLYDRFDIVGQEVIASMKSLAEWAKNVAVTADPALETVSRALRDMDLSRATGSLAASLASLVPTALQSVKATRLLSDKISEVRSNTEEQIQSLKILSVANADAKKKMEELQAGLESFNDALVGPTSDALAKFRKLLDQMKPDLDLSNVAKTFDEISKGAFVDRITGVFGKLVAAAGQDLASLRLITSARTNFLQGLEDTGKALAIQGKTKDEIERVTEALKILRGQLTSASERELAELRKTLAEILKKPALEAGAELRALALQVGPNLDKLEVLFKGFEELEQRVKALSRAAQLFGGDFAQFSKLQEQWNSFWGKSTGEAADALKQSLKDLADKGAGEAAAGFKSLIEQYRGQNAMVAVVIEALDRFRSGLQQQVSAFEVVPGKARPGFETELGKATESLNAFDKILGIIADAEDPLKRFTRTLDVIQVGDVEALEKLMDAFQMAERQTDPRFLVLFFTKAKQFAGFWEDFGKEVKLGGAQFAQMRAKAESFIKSFNLGPATDQFKQQIADFIKSLEGAAGAQIPAVFQSVGDALLAFAKDAQLSVGQIGEVQRLRSQFFSMLDDLISAGGEHAEALKKIRETMLTALVGPGNAIEALVKMIRDVSLDVPVAKLGTAIAELEGLGPVAKENTKTLIEWRARMEESLSILQKLKGMGQLPEDLTGLLSRLEQQLLTQTQDALKLFQDELKKVISGVDESFRGGVEKFLPSLLDAMNLLELKRSMGVTAQQALALDGAFRRLKDFLEAFVSVTLKGVVTPEVQSALDRLRVALGERLPGDLEKLSKELQEKFAALGQVKPDVFLPVAERMGKELGDQMDRAGTFEQFMLFARSLEKLRGLVAGLKPEDEAGKEIQKKLIAAIDKALGQALPADAIAQMQKTLREQISKLVPDAPDFEKQVRAMVESMQAQLKGAPLAMAQALIEVREQLIRQVKLVRPELAKALEEMIEPISLDEILRRKIEEIDLKKVGPQNLEATIATLLQLRPLVGQNLDLQARLAQKAQDLASLIERLSKTEFFGKDFGARMQEELAQLQAVLFGATTDASAAFRRMVEKFKDLTDPTKIKITPETFEKVIGNILAASTDLGDKLSQAAQMPADVLISFGNTVKTFQEFLEGLASVESRDRLAKAFGPEAAQVIVKAAQDARRQITASWEEGADVVLQQIKDMLSPARFDVAKLTSPAQAAAVLLEARKLALDKRNLEGLVEIQKKAQEVIGRFQPLVDILKATGGDWQALSAQLKEIAQLGGEVVDEMDAWREKLKGIVSGLDPLVAASQLKDLASTVGENVDKMREWLSAVDALKSNLQTKIDFFEEMGFSDVAESLKKLKEQVEAMFTGENPLGNLKRAIAEIDFSRPLEAAEQLLDLMQANIGLVMQDVKAGEMLVESKRRLFNQIEKQIEIYKDLGLPTKSLEETLDKLTQMFRSVIDVLKPFRDELGKIKGLVPLEAIKRIREIAQQVATGGGAEARAQLAAAQAQRQSRSQQFVERLTQEMAPELKGKGPDQVVAESGQRVATALDETAQKISEAGTRVATAISKKTFAETSDALSQALEKAGDQVKATTPTANDYALSPEELNKFSKGMQRAAAAAAATVTATAPAAQVVAEAFGEADVQQAVESALQELVDMQRAIFEDLRKQIENRRALGLDVPAELEKQFKILQIILERDLSPAAQRLALQLLELDLQPTVEAMQQVKQLAIAAGMDSEQLGLLAEESQRLIGEQEKLAQSLRALGFTQKAKELEQAIIDMKLALLEGSGEIAEILRLQFSKLDFSKPTQEMANQIAAAIPEALKQGGDALAVVAENASRLISAAEAQVRDLQAIGAPEAMIQIAKDALLAIKLQFADPAQKIMLQLQRQLEKLAGTNIVSEFMPKAGATGAQLIEMFKANMDNIEALKMIKAAMDAYQAKLKDIIDLLPPYSEAHKQAKEELKKFGLALAEITGDKLAGLRSALEDLGREEGMGEFLSNIQKNLAALLELRAQQGDNIAALKMIKDKFEELSRTLADVISLLPEGSAEWAKATEIQKQVMKEWAKAMGDSMFLFQQKVESLKLEQLLEPGGLQQAIEQIKAFAAEAGSNIGMLHVVAEARKRLESEFEQLISDYEALGMSTTALKGKMQEFLAAFSGPQDSALAKIQKELKKLEAVGIGEGVSSLAELMDAFKEESKIVASLQPSLKDGRQALGAYADLVRAFNQQGQEFVDALAAIGVDTKEFEKQFKKLATSFMVDGPKKRMAQLQMALDDMLSGFAGGKIDKAGSEIMKSLRGLAVETFGDPEMRKVVIQAVQDFGSKIRDEIDALKAIGGALGESDKIKARIKDLEKFLAEFNDTFEGSAKSLAERMRTKLDTILDLDVMSFGEAINTVQAEFVKFMQDNKGKDIFKLAPALKVFQDEMRGIIDRMREGAEAMEGLGFSAQDLRKQIMQAEARLAGLSQSALSVIDSLDFDRPAESARKLLGLFASIPAKNKIAQDFIIKARDEMIQSIEREIERRHALGLSTYFLDKELERAKAGFAALSPAMQRFTDTLKSEVSGFVDRVFGPIAPVINDLIFNTIGGALLNMLQDLVPGSVKLDPIEGAGLKIQGAAEKVDAALAGLTDQSTSAARAIADMIASSEQFSQAQREQARRVSAVIDESVVPSLGSQTSERLSQSTEHATEAMGGMLEAGERLNDQLQIQASSMQESTGAQGGYNQALKRTTAQVGLFGQVSNFVTNVLQKLADGFDRFGIGLDSIVKTFFGLLMQSKSFQRLMEELNPIIQTLADIVGLLLEPIVAFVKMIRKALGIKKEIDRSLSMSSANIPSGFKIERLRHQAAIAGQLPGERETGGGLTGLIGKISKFIETVLSILQPVIKGFVEGISMVAGFLLDLGRKILGPLIENSGPLLEVLGKMLAVGAAVIAGFLALKLVLDLVIGAVNGVIQIIGLAIGAVEAVGIIFSTIGDIITGIIAIFGNLGVLVESLIAVAFSPLGIAIGAVLALMLLAPEAFQKLLTAIWDVASSIIGLLKPVFEALSAVITPIVEVLGAVLGPIVSVLAKVFEGLAWVIKNVLTPAIEALAWLINIIMAPFRFIKWVLDLLGLGGKKQEKPPALQGGGFISSPGLALLHANEAVIPMAEAKPLPQLAFAGAGGPNMQNVVVVQGNLVIDDPDITRRIQEYVRRKSLAKTGISTSHTLLN